MSNTLLAGSMRSRTAVAVQRIKALLVPLENVCRYRESMGADSAEFHVTPRNRNAVGFSCAVAAGGINFECAHLAIREIPIDNVDFAVSVVAAILAGRLRVVRQLDAKGRLKAEKSYIFDVDGCLLFKNRRIQGFNLMKRRASATERLRFPAYI
jgi:hypothetical protein